MRDEQTNERQTLKIELLPQVFRKNWNKSFKMSYVEGVNLQNCPIDGHSKKISVWSQKNAKNRCFS